ncbi:MAG: hypothetical protein KAI47_07045 [Deltaproteobacteria bacterium]|nr:hypothetical protein [Deltaproteobacteria bacterium]
MAPSPVRLAQTPQRLKHLLGGLGILLSILGGYPFWHAFSVWRAHDGAAFWSIPLPRGYTGVLRGNLSIYGADLFWALSSLLVGVALVALAVYLHRRPMLHLEIAAADRMLRLVRFGKAYRELSFADRGDVYVHEKTKTITRQHNRKGGGTYTTTHAITKYEVRISGFEEPVYSSFNEARSRNRAELIERLLRTDSSLPEDAL